MQRKILHCIPTLLGGGAERQLSYLGPGLVERGWDVHVAYCRDGQNLDRLANGGVTLHQMNRTWTRDPRLLWDMVRLVREIRPTVIQSWLFQMDVVGGLAARFSGTPWILSERSSPSDHSASGRKWLRSRLGHTSDAVASNSVAGQEYWSHLVKRSTPNRVIPNGLPLDELQAVPPAALDGIPPHQYLIVHVGRFVSEKNIDLLLAAFSKLPSTLDWHAVLCGTGPLEKEMEEQARTAGLSERVTFLGYVPTVAQWLRRANLFVSLSQYEGHPNAVMEAMACGCPIVASDIPTHRECLGPDGATFVDSRSASIVAAAIESMLTYQPKAARCVKIAEERAQRWSLSSMVDQYESLYFDVLSRRGIWTSASPYSDRFDPAATTQNNACVAGDVES